MYSSKVSWLILSLLASAWGGEKKGPAPDPGLVRQRENIESVRKDSGKYVGYGMADYAKDRGKAREEAVARAEADLSKNIRVRIESTTRDFVSYTAQSGKDLEERSFSNFVSAKVDQVITQRGEEDCWDCLQPGLYSVVLFVDKKRVDEAYAAELGAKKDSVVERVKEAAFAVSAKDAAGALRGYLSAREKLADYFEGMPVKAPVGGELVDLGAHVDSRIGELAAGIDLAPVSGRMFYSSAGKPRGKPVVFAQIKSEDGERGVPKLPLLALFAKGSGRPAGLRSETDAFGKLELPLEWVDPSNTESVLEVRLDTAAFGAWPALMPIPKCVVALSRTKTVAFGVRFQNGASIGGLRSLEEGIRSLLAEMGYGTVKVKISGSDGPEDLEAARKENADYLLTVRIVASVRSEPDFNLNSAQGQSTVSMFDVQDASAVFVEAGPSGNGFGGDASSAGYNAAGKLGGGLIRLIQGKIQALR